MKKHIVSSYDWELKRLNSTVTDMGYLAMEQIEASIDAMRKRDSKKAKQIVLDDQKIDNLDDFQIKNPCVSSKNDTLTLLKEYTNLTDKQIINRLCIIDTNYRQ